MLPEALPHPNNELIQGNIGDEGQSCRKNMYGDLLAALIRDGKLEFEAQLAEITKLTDVLLA